MADWLEEHGVRLVVLAGYMHLLTPGFLARFPERVVNVHPSLLPEFPGVRPIEDIDIMGASVPYDLVRRIHGPLSRQMAFEDCDLHDRLRKVGFLSREADLVPVELLERLLEVARIRAGRPFGRLRDHVDHLAGLAAARGSGGSIAAVVEVLRQRLAREPAVDAGFADSVAAEAVGAVDAAGVFARDEQLLQ